MSTLFKSLLEILRFEFQTFYTSMNRMENKLALDFFLNSCKPYKNDSLTI